LNARASSPPVRSRSSCVQVEHRVSHSWRPGKCFFAIFLKASSSQRKHFVRCLGPVVSLVPPVLCIPGLEQRAPPTGDAAGKERWGRGRGRWGRPRQERDAGPRQRQQRPGARRCENGTTSPAHGVLSWGSPAGRASRVLCTGIYRGFLCFAGGRRGSAVVPRPLLLAFVTWFCRVSLPPML